LGTRPSNAIFLAGREVGTSENKMKQRPQFVTPLRAIIAFPISLAAGAMTFLPAIMAEGVPQVPSVFVGHGIVSNLLRFSATELGIALLGLAIFGLPIFPFYVCGVFVAKRLQTSHWLYFAALGILLASGLWIAAVLPQSRGVNHYSPYLGLIRFALPVGMVAGLVCWAFLYLTCSRNRALDSSCEPGL
jgi:hypothetical protein